MGTTVSRGDTASSTKNQRQQQPVDEPVDNEELQRSSSSLIIEEKERRRNMEQNEPETQMAITDAEKMLEIYRKEMKGSSESTPTLKNKQTDAYNKPKQELFSRPKQLYKTSDYDDCGRATIIPPPKSEAGESKAKDSSPTVSTLAKQTTEPMSVSSEIETLSVNKDRTEANVASQSSDKEVKETQKERQAEQKQLQLESKKSPELSCQKPGTHDDGLIGANETGSLLTKNVSAHCPDLLEQKSSVSTASPLKPLTQSTLSTQRQLVRSELENQGIVAPGTYVEAAQQDILHELKDAGIIRRNTFEEKYVMSVGSPVRRPPPRVTQLPPLTTSPSSKEAEGKVVELRKPRLPVDKRDFSFIDFGRPLPARSDKVIAGEEKKMESMEVREQRPRATSDMKTEAGYFITREDENIGDANMLLKMFDLDTL